MITCHLHFLEFLILRHILYILFFLITTFFTRKKVISKEESTLEGASVTLSYKYTRIISASDDFFWYRQFPGKSPEFLIYISGLNISKSSESFKSTTKFVAKLTGKEHLISSAAVTDSAVYYCAVEPTVTGNNKTLYKNNPYIVTAKHLVICKIFALFFTFKFSSYFWVFTFVSFYYVFIPLFITFV
uniref:Immunoglobulin V-set domain-containing protein n=1 Tax=Oryzias melastigma TaxID=30732 RepID=A0A3B3DE35_ORYME